MTISNSELVKDYSKYLIFNKPQYTQELSKYLSYDIYYQAKQITSINKYNEAKELIKTSLKYHSENMEAQIEQEKLDVVIKTTDIKNAVADENKKTPLDINKILKEHQQIIFDNYISNNPNREKAFLSANAIFEYERATNYLNIDSYNSVNPGYIMMVFGEYDKAEEFFKRNSSALGFYDLGVLNLLRNDYTKFALYINKALCT